MSEAGLFTTDSLPTDCQCRWMKWSVLCIRAKNIPIIVFPDWNAARCLDWDGWSLRCQSLITSASAVSLYPLQVPRLTLASASTAATAAADTDTWTAWERSLETAWTSSTSPQTHAWAACSRSACGMTTKVPKQTHRSGINSVERGRTVRRNPSLSLSLSGLSPAWLLQYVLVKDLQTGSSYFFLVEEWLSVDNEKTDGRVEIEVEASGKVPPPQIKHRLWLVGAGCIRPWIFRARITYVFKKRKLNPVNSTVCS